MTISSDAVRKAGPFVGNSIVTVFAFAFKTFSASDLSVTLLTTATGVQQLLVLNTDYTVQLNANQDINPGGTVTTIGAISPIPNTQTLTTSGNVMPDTQGTDLITPGPWVPDDVEKMVDRSMIATQQLRDRAIKFPVIDSVAPVDLPPAEARKNTTFIFDGNGQVAVGAVTTVAVPTTAGGVLFGTGVGVAVDATKLFWDNANKILQANILRVAGTLPSQGATANTGFIDALNGMRFFSLGPNGATQGAWSWISYKGDGTNVLTPMSLTGAGALSVAGDVTLAGTGGTGGHGYIVGPATAAKDINIQIGNATGAVNIRSSIGTVQFSLLPSASQLQLGTPGFVFTYGSSPVTLSTTSGGIDFNVAGNPVRFPGLGTTANVTPLAILNTVGSNDLLRSTSSVRYKNVLRDFDLAAARALITKAKPIVFESKSMADYAGEEYVGFLAEDIITIDQRFATLDERGRPDNVQYPIFVVPLSLMAADHERRIAALEKAMQH